MFSVACVVGLSAGFVVAWHSHHVWFRVAGASFLVERAVFSTAESAGSCPCALNVGFQPATCTAGRGLPEAQQQSDGQVGSCPLRSIEPHLFDHPLLAHCSVSGVGGPRHRVASKAWLCRPSLCVSSETDKPSCPPTPLGSSACPCPQVRRRAFAPQ